MSGPNSEELILMRQTAAQYLAAALCDLFPKTLLVGGGGTSRCFYYDCVLPFVYSEGMLPMIEERMHALIREKMPIKMHEMMASNAAELMCHREQFLIAEKLKESSSSTVHICQIGTFYNESSTTSFCKDSLSFFKLISAFDLKVLKKIEGKTILRIVGVLETQKDQLKKTVKQFTPSSQNHLSLVSDYFLPFQETSWIWLPKAEALRDQLCKWWRQEHLTQNFNFVSASYSSAFTDEEQRIRESHIACMQAKNFSKIAEICTIPASEPLEVTDGILSTPESFSDRAHLSCSDEKLLEEVISSLQFITKIPKILGFEFEMAMSISSAGKKGSRQKAVSVFNEALTRLGLNYTSQKEYRPGIHIQVNVQLFDSLGRRWNGPFLAYSDRMPQMPVSGVDNLLIRSAFGSMERVVGLMLENGKQQLSLPPGS